MEQQIKDIINKIDSDIQITIEDGNVSFSKEDWDSEVEFVNEYDKLDDLITKIEKWANLFKSIKEIIEKKDKDIKVWTNGEIAIFQNEQWGKDLEFPMDEELYDSDNILEEVKAYFELKYIPVKACYTDNYFEVLVNLPEVFWGDGLSGVHFIAEDEHIIENRIHYEVSNISNHFANLIESKQYYRNFEVVDSFSTLKIYNINKVAGTKVSDSDFEEKVWYFAKCILFELASKHSLAINIYELPEDDEEGFELEEIVESLNETENPYLRKQYDSDLIDYYHRALIMLDSEFKYLAFYQILECIFDEVYQHETIQDVKQIMNSSWFSTYSNDNISQIIEVVDRYNKSKNDREKLKLVLDRYFKGEIHEQAFLIANKDIIDVLKTKLKKITKDTELNDLQKLTNVIYDFRCDCTHSNRTYPFRATFDKTKEELSHYIELIRKVAERVISNYPGK